MSSAVGADPVDGIAFLQRVLALIERGQKSATYKPAVLLALINCCARRDLTRADVGITIPVTEVASEVICLYWDQIRPYPGLPDGQSRLRQGSGDRLTGGQGRMAPARIPEAVRLLQEQCGSGIRRPEQAAVDNPQAWQRAVGFVAGALAKQPLHRLQTLGSAADPRRNTFLFDDSEFGEGIGASVAISMNVELRPGVARALVMGASLLRPAIEVEWSRLVASFNKLVWPEADLRSFLFDSERTALGRVRAALIDVEGSRCFWCGGSIRGSAAVDHVIPWSAFPNDSLFNLVVSDGKCNGDKSNRLVVPHLLESWASRDRAVLNTVADDLVWPLGFERSRVTAVAAYSTLADGLPLWEARGVWRLASLDLRSQALHVLEAAA